LAASDLPDFVQVRLIEVADAPGEYFTGSLKLIESGYRFL
jgi:hypothetical protein